MDAGRRDAVIASRTVAARVLARFFRDVVTIALGIYARGWNVETADQLLSVLNEAFVEALLAMRWARRR